MVVESAVSSGNAGDSWQRKQEDGGGGWTSVRHTEDLEVRDECWEILRCTIKVKCIDSLLYWHCWIMR